MSGFHPFLKKRHYERLYRVPWAIAGHVFFTVGNILWIVSPAMCWVYGTPGICYNIEFVAAVCFLFNGTFQLLEIWCLDYEYRLVGGYLQIYGGGIGTDPIRTGFESINWFFLMHLFFFYGALGDVTTGSIDSWTNYSNTTWWSMWSDFIASTLWFISAIFAIICWFLNSDSRIFHKARIVERMFPCFLPDSGHSNPLYNSSTRSSEVWFSFSGWSQWLYALASLIYMGGAFLCYYFSDGNCWAPQLLAATIFFLQGVFDMVDFYRRRFNYEMDLADEQDSLNLYLSRCGLTFDDLAKQQNTQEPSSETTYVLESEDEDYGNSTSFSCVQPEIAVEIVN
eukprot:TRINITY_DN17406_c0_g1_i1.p1 TRINITY_DN17406_c0_g1~~TRINITY_DN17406_c0_g1_i1.p1  ORF type:complete len:339 (-),score=21.02 TRINITY_DN17406_c0_g1_i1:91-1107(-)